MTTFDDMIAQHKASNVGQKPRRERDPEEVMEAMRAEALRDRRARFERVKEKFQPGAKFLLLIEDADGNFSLSFSARFVRWVTALHGEPEDEFPEWYTHIAEFDNGVRLRGSYELDRAKRADD